MMTMAQAEQLYDAARDQVAQATRAMIDAHDLWQTFTANMRSGYIYRDGPSAEAHVQSLWEKFSQRNDEWQQAMAALKIARRRYERLRL